MAKPKTTPASSLAKLSDDQIEAALRALPEWSHVADTIQRTYVFKDFLVSIRFVNAVAVEAERVQHHPDMLIRYSRVTMTLSTHDANGITQKDFALAKASDAIATDI